MCACVIRTMSGRVLMASTTLLLLLPGHNGNGTGMRRFRSVRHAGWRITLPGAGVVVGSIPVLFVQRSGELIVVFNSKRQKQSYNRSEYVVNNENLFKKQIYRGNRF